MSSILQPPSLGQHSLLVQQAVQNIDALVWNMYQSNVNGHTQLFNLVWNNPNATPAEIFAALGSTGASLMQIAQIHKDMVNQIAAAAGQPGIQVTEPTNKWTITPQSDGSILLTPIAANSSSSGSSGS